MYAPQVKRQVQYSDKGTTGKELGDEASCMHYR